MKKLKAKFVPATVFCLVWLILVFQFGCQFAQTQANSPSSLATMTTPTPEVILPRVEPESETYAGNVAGNSNRGDDSKQDDDAATNIDFEIKGVGIGTLEAKVIQKLGKPLRSKNGVVDGCGSEFQKTLRYSGLVLVLEGDDKGRNYSVISVDVTSSKWMADSVLKIGEDAKDVETTFENHYNKEVDEGQTIFYYSLRRHDGGAKIFFQNNKLTRISWSLNLC